MIRSWRILGVAFLVMNALPTLVLCFMVWHSGIGFGTFFSAVFAPVAAIDDIIDRRRGCQ